MLVIRLTRIGKKNQPSYRVVLTEKQNPVRGKFIEILGSYDPRLKTKSLKTERIKYWLSKGAQPSDTLHNLLVSEKILDAKKVKAWTPKKKSGEARKAKEAAASAEASTSAEASEDKSEAKEAAKVAEEAKNQSAKESVVEEVKEEKTEAPVEEVKDEVKEEKPAEEAKTE